jgi:hypothetical protein
MNRLYCYAQQRTAVDAILRPILAPGVKVHLVTGAHQLMGSAPGGTFVTVIGHPNRIPSEIQDTLRARGFMVIALDDSYAREAAKR